MSPIENILFVIIFTGAIAFFLKNVFRLVATICLGRPENRFDNLWSRFGAMLVYGFGQLRVIKEKFGYNHLLLFWGFMTLALVNFEFLLLAFSRDSVLIFSGTAVRHFNVCRRYYVFGSSGMCCGSRR